ncbi:uncharacterized protein L199_008422 [Kwoniella botswanensis]|uniref:uncharacterized protein n=1 Tax=Kwoniella botswanensis TaxID=1268659 RepID=UPI00315DE7CF
MDCTPTPISTIFSTSTSLIPSTITSSSAVLVTPSGSISTWVVTYCSTPPVPSQSTDTTTFTISPTSTDSMSISISTTASDSSSSGNDVISFGMTSMTTGDGGTLTTTAVDSPTSPVGQLQEETTLAVLDGQTLSSDESQSLLLSSHQRGMRGRTEHVKVIKKRQENCQTITSTSTITATPTTSWSLIFSTTESTSLIEVPVETVMGGCDGTTTTASSTEQLNITTDPPTLSTITSAAAVITSAPTQTSSSILTTSLEETSTSILPSSSIPVSESPTPTFSSSSSSVQDLETVPALSSSSTSLDPLLSAVFTGPSLTIESGQSSITDLLAPITSDAIPTAQPTEIDSADTEPPLSSDTPIIPDDEATTSAEAEAEDTSSTNADIPGVAGIQTFPSSSKSMTNTLASQNSNPTLNHNPSTSSTGGEEAEGATSGSNKGTAAGAAIGGIFALIALIAAILFFVRFWKKRQRAERTVSLRASWFYGEKILNHNDGSENEKRRSAPAPSTEPSARPSIQPVSRFSAPSFASRSEGLGALLARPLKNLRRDSSPLMKPLKLVSGDPNQEARRNEDDSIWGKLAYSFKGIPLPSTEGISERLRTIPGFKPRRSFTVKSRNISSPQPIDPEIATGTNNGIFESSKLLPIFSKFRSIRQSFKRSSILSSNLKYIRQSQVRGTPAWAEKHPNEKPIPVMVGQAWDERHSESDHPHPVKVNFMQPPPPSATGSSSKHGSMNSDSPYPTIVPGNSPQNHGIGTAFGSGMDMEMEYNKPTHVQLRHLTWGSSYAPPRTSILSANGMMIHGAMEPSEDGNSIYSRTSMSHGYGSDNLHRSGTMKSNFSDSTTSNFMVPPRSSTSHNSGNGGNVPSPPPIGIGPFPRALLSPLSAGSNGSRGSFGVLPPLPENGIDTDKHMKDLRRITRSTQQSSGIWEYSAYVDTGSNANSQRGSGSNGNSNSNSEIQGQGQRRISNGQSSLTGTGTGTGPMGILKSTSSCSPLPPTMIYPNSNSNSPIPIYAPNSAFGPGDIPYTVPSPKRMSYGGSMLKHSSLPPSSPPEIEISSLPLPPQPQRSYTSPIPSILAPKSAEEGDRITKAWYEKPLWDNTQQSQQNQAANPTSILLPPRSAGPGSGPDHTYMYSQNSGNSIYSKGDRASRTSVKSVKSVRWEDEDRGDDEGGGGVARAL